MESGFQLCFAVFSDMQWTVSQTTLRVHGIVQKKILLSYTFKNGKLLEKRPVFPRFHFKIIVADGYFEMVMNGNI